MTITKYGHVTGISRPSPVICAVPEPETVQPSAQCSQSSQTLHVYFSLQCLTGDLYGCILNLPFPSSCGNTLFLGVPVFRSPSRCEARRYLICAPAYASSLPEQDTTNVLEIVSPGSPISPGANLQRRACWRIRTARTGNPTAFSPPSASMRVPEHHWPFGQGTVHPTVTHDGCYHELALAVAPGIARLSDTTVSLSTATGKVASNASIDYMDGLGRKKQGWRKGTKTGRPDILACSASLASTTALSTSRQFNTGYKFAPSRLYHFYVTAGSLMGTC